MPIETRNYPVLIRLTTLEAQGFDDPRPECLVERFARHLLAADDRLQEIGFAAVAKAYVSRLARQRGVRHDIAENATSAPVGHASRPQPTRAPLTTFFLPHDLIPAPSFSRRPCGFARSVRFAQIFGANRRVVRDDCLVETGR